MRLLTLTLIHGLVLMPGCTTTTAYVNQKMPPFISLKKSEKVVVEAFDGKNGYEVAQLIEDALLREGYRVLDRSNFTPIMREKILAGKINHLPANILIGGRVVSQDVRLFPHSETIDCGGRTGTRSSLTASAMMAAHVRFTRVSTGDLFNTDNITVHAEESTSWDNCDGKVRREPVRDYAMKKMAKEFVERFKKNISTYDMLVPVELFVVKDIPEVGQGHSYLKESKFAKAESSYRSALKKAETDEQKGHVHYALGVSLGYQGKEEAFKHLGEGMRINPEGAYVKQKEWLEKYFEIL